MQTSQLFTALQQRQQQRDHRYIKGLVVTLVLALAISLCAVTFGFGQHSGLVNTGNYLSGSCACPELWLS